MAFGPKDPYYIRLLGYFEPKGEPLGFRVFKGLHLQDSCFVRRSLGSKSVDKPGGSMYPNNILLEFGSKVLLVGATFTQKCILFGYMDP